VETEDFELPSGEVVRIRGLSAYEVMLSKKKSGDDLAINAFMLSCALGITESEAEHWMKTHVAGDFVALVDRIQEISGLSEGAVKAASKSVP